MIKKLLLLFVVMLVSGVSLNAQQVSYKLSEEVKKKCNAFSKLTVENDSAVTHVYFYYQRAKVDTVIISEKSQCIADFYACTTKDTIVERKTMKLRRGKIWLVDQNGKVLYQYAFDDVKVCQPLIYEYETLDPTCSMIVFDGFKPSYDYWYTSLKGDENIYHLDAENQVYSYSEATPFMVCLKGKWALFDIKKGLLTDFEFDRIEPFERGFRLYKGKVPTQIMVFPDAKHVPRILESS